MTTLIEHLICCRQLNPLEAPLWSVTVRLADNSHCKLGEYCCFFCAYTKTTVTIATGLDSFLKLSYYQETMRDILGEGSSKSSQDTNKSELVAMVTMPNVHQLTVIILTDYAVVTTAPCNTVPCNTAPCNTVP